LCHLIHDGGFQYRRLDTFIRVTVKDLLAYLIEATATVTLVLQTITIPYPPGRRTSKKKKKRRGSFINVQLWID